MRNLVFVLALLALCSCKLQLRSVVTFTDLDSNDHLNNMIVNTLNIKEKYVSEKSLHLLGTFIPYTYSVTQATSAEIKSLQKYLLAALGSSFLIARHELDEIIDKNQSEIWNIFIGLVPSSNGVLPTVAMLRWDSINKKLDCHTFASPQSVPSSLTQNQIVKFSSIFGIEAGEATLLSE